jgi:hypothetical protein
LPEEYEEIGAFKLLGGCQIMKLFWKTDWQFIQKLNTDFSSDPEILLLAYTKEKLNHMSTQKLRHG